MGESTGRLHFRRRRFSIWYGQSLSRTHDRRPRITILQDGTLTDSFVKATWSKVDEIERSTCSMLRMHIRVHVATRPRSLSDSSPSLLITAG
jgi:hypothetical protein